MVEVICWMVLAMITKALSVGIFVAVVITVLLP